MTMVVNTRKIVLLLGLLLGKYNCYAKEEEKLNRVDQEKVQKATGEEKQIEPESIIDDFFSWALDNEIGLDAFNPELTRNEDFITYDDKEDILTFRLDENARLPDPDNHDSIYLITEVMPKFEEDFSLYKQAFLTFDLQVPKELNPEYQEFVYLRSWPRYFELRYTQDYECIDNGDKNCGMVYDFCVNCGWFDYGDGPEELSTSFKWKSAEYGNGWHSFAIAMDFEENTVTVVHKEKGESAEVLHKTTKILTDMRKTIPHNEVTGLVEDVRIGLRCKVAGAYDDGNYGIARYKSLSMADSTRLLSSEITMLFEQEFASYLA